MSNRHTINMLIKLSVIADESAAALTLKRADGATDTVLRCDIASLTGSGLSLMPEGVEAVILKCLQKERARSIAEDIFPKLVEHKGQMPVIKDQLPTIFHAEPSRFSFSSARRPTK